MASQSVATAQHYLTQQVQSASKEQLLLMLFDGAIRFLKVARKAMDDKDIQTSHNHLLKTQKILAELMATLNLDVGGEPARNLMALYEYYYYRLVQANLKKDTSMVDEVMEHLVDLRQTWDQAIKIHQGTQAGVAEALVSTGQAAKAEGTASVASRQYSA